MDVFLNNLLDLHGAISSLLTYYVQGKYLPWFLGLLQQSYFCHATQGAKLSTLLLLMLVFYQLNAV